MKGKLRKLLHGLNKGAGLIEGPVVGAVASPFVGIAAACDYWYTTLKTGLKNHDFNDIMIFPLLPMFVAAGGGFAWLITIPVATDAAFKNGASHMFSTFKNDYKPKVSSRFTLFNQVGNKAVVKQENIKSHKL